MVVARGWEMRGGWASFGLLSKYTQTLDLHVCTHTYGCSILWQLIMDSHKKAIREDFLAVLMWSSCSRKRKAGLFISRWFYFFQGVGIMIMKWCCEYMHNILSLCIPWVQWKRGPPKMGLSRRVHQPLHIEHCTALTCRKSMVTGIFLPNPVFLLRLLPQSVAVLACQSAEGDAASVWPNLTSSSSFPSSRGCPWSPSYCRGWGLRCGQS